MESIFSGILYVPAGRPSKTERSSDAASDVSDKTWKNLRYEAESAGVPAVRLLAGMEELGRACGKKAGVFAVTDEGFAKAILGMTDVVKREKEEHAL